MIVIIDYGLGNLGSLHNMFKRIGSDAVISGDMELIAKADKLLLPGVGAFDQAMRRINDGGYRDVLEHKVKVEKTPLLGICLGMQLLAKSSEEGDLPGLGWVDAKVTRISGGKGLKVPHMGWNIVVPQRPSPLTLDLPKESRFYFVHSYCVHVEREKNSILKATYGVTFDAGIQEDNIYGVQFHPEKSHRFGMQLLKNFAGL